MSPSTEVHDAPADATFDTVHHLVWCHDHGRALCGANVDTVPFVDEPPSCVVCVELDRANPEYDGEGCNCPCCSPAK